MADDDLTRIRKAIAAQEALLGTGVLPDAQIQDTLATLREKAAALTAPARGTVSADQGGVGVGGNVDRSLVNTGTIEGDVHLGGTPPGSLAEADLRRAYLNRVRAGCSHLFLSGVDRAMGGKEDTRLSLNAVYTALLTLAPREREQGLHGYLRDREAGEGRLSALEELNAHPHLVLQGDPGSGKSTFVRFVALCLAGEAVGDAEVNLARLTRPLPDEAGREGEQAQPWDHGALLPVVVVLRDFAATGLPARGETAGARHLWAFIEADLAAGGLADYGPHLRKHLLTRGGLLLLDGLDEVPEAEQRREQVKQAVEDFATVHDRCRVLVTSRTYAYQNQDWRLAGFDEAVLAALSDGQIRRFVERWYAHAAALGKYARTDAEGRAERLKQAIFGRGRLLGLARRPLLLTLIASLHAWRGGTLPERRERLYADTVELLLDFWEQRRLRHDADGRPSVLQPSIAEWLQADREQVRAVLESLAFAAHAAQPEVTGTADLAEGELVGRLMRLHRGGNPAQLVDYLRERAGLLLPHGVGVYTFPHRSFQEYLAACWLTGDTWPEEIARLARRDPDRWREVALLAGAKAARGAGAAIWQLAEELCFRSPDDPQAGPEDCWGAQIAAQALAETADLERVSEANRGKLTRIRTWLVRLLVTDAFPATERALAGDSLARLGDPRFDAAHGYLPAEPLLGFREVPAGRFVMGSEDRRDSWWSSAGPRHELTLPAFYLSRWPVTVAQFRAFLAARHHQPDDDRCREGPGNRPVVYVTWHDAIAYCRWLGERLVALAPAWLADPQALDAPQRAFWQGLAEGRLGVGLPSEAEWEKAARGDDGRAYPWGGEEADPERANYEATGIGGTTTVGCFPRGASPCGCEELSGNVWEWTRSQAGDYPYPDDPKERSEREDLNAGGRRVLRGGAFGHYPYPLRCAARYDGSPDFRSDDLGFRVVVSPFL